MERVGVRMRLQPGKEEEYRRRHRAVWPELLHALRQAGCHNYTICLDDDDLFAYLEVDNLAYFLAAMSNSDANRRWQAAMQDIIDPMTDPETGFHHRLEEVFHLD
jgi:L-rhamnose mutarotase